MDCPTNSDFPNMIDEAMARDMIGDRFNVINFRKMTDTNGKICRDTFLLELDHVDVYISHARNPTDKDKISRINQILIQKGLTTIYDEGRQVEQYIDAANLGDEKDPCSVEFLIASTEKKAAKMIPVCLEESVQDPLCWGGIVGRTLAGRLCLNACGDLLNEFYVHDRTEELYQRVLRVVTKSDTIHISTNASSMKPSRQKISANKILTELDNDDVSNMLDYHGLGNYMDEFRENQVDGECLALCESAQELKDMGVHLIPKARLLMGKIAMYKEQGVPREVLRGADGRNKSAGGSDMGEASNAGSGWPAEGGKRATYATMRKKVAAAASTGTNVSVAYAASRLQCVRVSGCTGERARDINGVYEPTEEKFDGFCRYLKRGGQNNWMEYNAARGHWHIKKAESKGSVNAWAYCMSSIVAPPDRIGGSWHVYNGADFPEQSMLKVTTVYDSIMVQGAVGACSQPVNGIYDPTSEECGGWVRYRKRWARHDCWMEYNEARGQWHIKPAASKGTTNAWAYFSCRPVCAPDKHREAVWYMYDGSRFVKQENVVAVIEPVPICIKGAMGSCMQQVNGIFDPCSDVYGGFVRYRKRGGQDCWMEYHEQRRQWHIKPDSSKTTTNAWAYAVYPTPMSPHLLRSVWHLYDGRTFEKQLDVVALPELKPVIVSGAAGNVAPQVNGIFDPTDEICNGWVRYKKRGGQDCWMEYMESKGQWHIKPAASKNSTNAWAYASCKPVQAPHEIGDIWRLYDGSKFEDHPMVKVTAEDTQEDRDLMGWLAEIQR